jgi:glutamate/aspartate transport system permease protein
VITALPACKIPATTTCHAACPYVQWRWGACRHWWNVHAGTTVYVNVLRSSPFLMVIFWFYAVVPFITGWPVSPYFAALTAIAAFEVAYVAEIIQSRLGRVRGARERLVKSQVLWLIILPQAVRRMMPTLLSQALITFQESTVASVISVPEIADTTTVVNSRDPDTIFPYSALALIFFVLCYSLSVAIRYVDGRSRRRLIGLSPEDDLNCRANFAISMSLRGSQSIAPRLASYPCRCFNSIQWS